MAIVHMSKTVFNCYLSNLVCANVLDNNESDICVHHKEKPIGMFISMERYEQLRILELTRQAASNVVNPYTSLSASNK